jgi:hypothetical protein
MSTIAWPTMSAAAYPSSLRWELRANTQSFMSPLSGAVETVELPGARWACSFSMPALQGNSSRNDSGIFQGWLMRLRGQANRAALYNFKRPTPIGTINLTGVTVSGVVAAGASSCYFAGGGDGKTLMDGDMFAVNGELKMVVNGPYTQSGSPSTIGPISFEPPTRAAWANGDAVTLNKPTALFILQNPQVGGKHSPGDINEYELDMIEVFA